MTVKKEGHIWHIWKKDTWHVNGRRDWESEQGGSQSLGQDSSGHLSKIKIEMYQQQKGNGLWLVGINSRGKAVRGDAGKKIGKGSQLNTKRNDVKTDRKLRQTFFGWSRRRGPHPPRRRDPEQTPIVITENEKDDIKVCVCLYRSMIVYFHFSKAVDYFFSDF